jgi:hypothetical protein
MPDMNRLNQYLTLANQLASLAIKEVFGINENVGLKT